MFGTKYELFLPPYQITFFLSFGQAIIFSSYHILMSILIHIFCDKEISKQWSIQKIINELQTIFQNKKKTCFNKMTL